MPKDLTFGPEEITDGGVRLMGDAGWEWRERGPSAETARAFGVRTEDLRRMPGGAGFVWTDGRLVIKPVGCVPEHDWVCEVYAGWSDATIRVPEPVRPAGGDRHWSADGWGAHVFLAGRDADLLDELPLVKDAGEAFHQAVADLPRPTFMDDRDDPWAYGDRLAWEDVAPEADEQTGEVIARLRAAAQPVTSRAQPVHGDLLPNVLIGEGGGAPGIIDWPPYFRPAAFAPAIAVHDAITFRGAPLTLIDDWATGPDWGQVLIRAILYRLGPTGLLATRNRLMGSLRSHVERVRPLVATVLEGVG